MAKTEILHMRVDKDLTDKLDYYCNRAGLNRTKLVTNMIESCFVDLDILDKTGMLCMRDLILQSKRSRNVLEEVIE